MIIVTLLGLVLTCVALISLLVSSWNKPPFDGLRDTERFLMEYAKWEPLIFERYRTIRSIKRFANRARSLVAAYPHEIACSLIGFVALDELGVDDVSRDDFSFDDWKQTDWRGYDRSQISERRASIIIEWIADTAKEDVKTYRLLTKGPPIP